MMRRTHSLLLSALLVAGSVLSGPGCKSDRPAPDTVHTQVVPSGTSIPGPHQKKVLTPPSIHLRIYPDMAVPGKEVVVEAGLIPDTVAESPSFTFRTLKDPCEGSLTQEGRRAVYAVPSDCRGSGITLEIVVNGSFGELKKVVDLDIKKTSFMDSVVFTFPVPGQNAQSPVSVWWDRTLYQNRDERLTFKVKRKGEFILDTGSLDPDRVIELDIPPSPEEIVLFGETSSGSQETALVRVHKRRVPEWPSSVLMIDRFSLPDTNSMEAERTVLDEGGECELGTAYRISTEGREPYLYMHYHVSKAKRYGRNEALMGFREEVPVSATLADYRELEVWLRGDPVRGCASPVYVRVEGNRGSTRSFKIKRIREDWRPYHFPLARALRRGDERVKAVSIFVDAKDVTPPLGTVLFGGLYLRQNSSKPSK
jgi:hypothetical protein